MLQQGWVWHNVQEIQEYLTNLTDVIYITHLDSIRVPAELTAISG